MPQDILTHALKSIKNHSIHIAKGILISKSPDTSVGGKEIGSGSFEVYVKTIIKKDEPLMKPYESYKTIGMPLEELLHGLLVW